jgi:hypothetical protein
MRITPRSIVLASAVLATAAFTTHTAAAETLRVPFDFSVNGKTLPAGEYNVLRDNLANFVRLENTDASKSYTWTLEPGDPAPGSTAVTMFFDKDGSSYSLRSIQYHALTTARIDRRHKEDSTVRVVSGM